MLRITGYEADNIRGGFAVLNKMKQTKNSDSHEEMSAWIELGRERSGMESAQVALQAQMVDAHRG